ncbi:MAG TPA: CDC27 family protein [Sulfuricurvum sp.]|nr:CDC27 family protein [Sulfuricurvum sp.]
MLDISKLERRWLKYKLKSILPYTLSGIVLITMIISIPFIFSKTAVKMPLSSEKKGTLHTNSPVIEKSTGSNSAMILEPSMQFMQTMEIPLSQNELQPATAAEPHKSSAITDQKTVPSSLKPIAVAEVSKPSIPPVHTVQTAPAKEKISSVKKGDAAFNIHEIEERFKNNSNANLGLYIAHYHYEHGNYPEAYNYALKTNAINNTLDENWLIFAKSLVKLGKKEQAKKTLQLYISNSNSDSAKSYLDILNKENDK